MGMIAGNRVLKLKGTALDRSRDGNRDAAWNHLHDRVKTAVKLRTMAVKRSFVDCFHWLVRPLWC